MTGSPRKKAKNPKYFLKDKKNQTVYLDINIHGDERGRLEIILFCGVVKKTCANFLQLCTGKNCLQQKRKSYKKCVFHRMFTGFMIQGGDIVKGDGTGNISIYGDTFDDENFLIDHAKYAVAMANSGKNTNGSQFYICTDTEGCQHLNGKNVVFGYINNDVSQQLVDDMENDCSTLLGDPQRVATISKCGKLKK